MINFYGIIAYCIAEAINDVIRLMGVEYPAQWLFVVTNTWTIV